MGVFLLKVKREYVGNFVFTEIEGSVCPLDVALSCEFVGSCDVIIGLDSPCVKFYNRSKVR